MRIGFDIRPALKKNSRRRGIGRYTFELARALLEVNTKHDFLLYAIAGDMPAFCSDHQIRQIAYLKHPSRLNWLVDLLLLRRSIGRDNLNLFHATELTSLSRPGSAQLWVTVHDLIPYIFWEETVRSVPRDFAWFLKLAWKRVQLADLIITDSEHSKSDICERMGVPAERVEVVYLGSGEKLQPMDRELSTLHLKERYGIEGPFLFYVGGSDHRKNLKLLIRAFAQIRKGGYEGQLVLAGETFLLDIAEVREVQSQVQSSGLEAVVFFPGFVPDEDLSRFYSACDFFVFPSLYEGFGLPVLEAMKCGAPVLVSRTSSLPEVAGDCAHYFDPEEEGSLVDVFWKAYESPGTVAELRDRAADRAGRFTWHEAAQKMHLLYGQHGM